MARIDFMGACVFLVQYVSPGEAGYRKTRLIICAKSGKVPIAYIMIHPTKARIKSPQLQGAKK